ncbi:MAG: hypothetical protein PHG85_01015 [Candidatus Altiarchaeota archaeon]|nr:hypothetical protein [Candidatus Altiarchaeota archaeon]
MTEKTIQDGGLGQRHAAPKLPDLKPVTEIIVGASNTRWSVHEGLGGDKDIVVIGQKPDGMEGPRQGVIYPWAGFRFLSSRGVDHPAAACLIDSYAREKGIRRPDLEDLMFKSIRFDAGFDGPDLVFTVDLKPGDTKAVEVFAMLNELGVSKDRIRFDPSQFKRR